MMIGELMDVTRLLGVGWLVDSVRAVNPHAKNTIKAVNAKEATETRTLQKKRGGGNAKELPMWGV